MGMQLVGDAASAPPPESKSKQLPSSPSDSWSSSYPDFSSDANKLKKESSIAMPTVSRAGLLPVSAAAVIHTCLMPRASCHVPHQQCYQEPHRFCCCRPACWRCGLFWRPWSHLMPGMNVAGAGGTAAVLDSWAARAVRGGQPGEKFQPNAGCANSAASAGRGAVPGSLQNTVPPSPYVFGRAALHQVMFLELSEDSWDVLTTKLTTTELFSKSGA